MEAAEQFMNAQDQLDHIAPLLDQIQQLLAQGQHPDASARFKQDEVVFDQYLADSVPDDVKAAAQLVQNWFAMNTIGEWAYKGIQSRKPAPEPSGIEGGTVKGNTALAECADYHEKWADTYADMGALGAATGHANAAKHKLWATAIREADNN